MERNRPTIKMNQIDLPPKNQIDLPSIEPNRLTINWNEIGLPTKETKQTYHQMEHLSTNGTLINEWNTYQQMEHLLKNGTVQTLHQKEPNRPTINWNK